MVIDQARVMPLAGVCDHDQEFCTLERRPAVEDERKDDGFDRPDQAQADCRKHHIRIVRREPAKSPAEPEKRHPAIAFAPSFHHRQLTALAGASDVTAASALAGADGSLSTAALAASAPVCPASTTFASVQTTVPSAFGVACPGA
ncbi:MAG: hypothetical protein IOC89_09030 [Rhodobacter sp.]|nr:hypothetical protein [Rhodobacter sp.]